MRLVLNCGPIQLGPEQDNACIIRARFGSRIRAASFLLYSPVALCLHTFRAVRAVSKHIKYESQEFMSLTSECIEYEDNGKEDRDISCQNGLIWRSEIGVLSQLRTRK